ncbi:MAG: hypothetical protein HN884_11250 [Rhodospirillaceae bacterium]|nr:hypothetical protein [Rhodospirillaceae bacterium]
MGEELVQMMFHISNPPTPLVTLDLIQGPERCLKLDSGLRQNDGVFCESGKMDTRIKSARDGGLLYKGRDTTPRVILDLIQDPGRCLRLDSGLRQNDGVFCEASIFSVNSVSSLVSKNA